MGNVNEITPDGTKTTNQTGSYSWTDPYTNESYTVPKFTTTQTLSPEQQAIKNQLDETKLGLGTLANTQTQFLQGYMGKPFSFDDQKHTEWATGLYNKINGQRMAQEKAARQAELSNMGLGIGSEAYNKEMNRVADSQSRAFDQFLLDSYQTDFQTQQALRNQPINEITALMSGSQVSQPNWANTRTATIPTTDNAGIIANYDQQRAAAAAQNAASIGGLFSGIGSLFALSDENAKKDIEKVGKVAPGMNAYEYRYKGESPDAPKRLGLMAQEVEKVMPEAVAEGADGFKRVNYSMALGLAA